MEDFLFAPAEFKFAADTSDKPTGEFAGYASVFGNVDSHGDVILPGSFTKTIQERKTAGRIVPMHLMHGIKGDGIPVGVWRNIKEDGTGLLAEGKISGMNTDAGRLLFERVKDGVFGGLSIGYRIPPGGASFHSTTGGTKARRTISELHLGEISLVDDPSNASARVHEVKMAAGFVADTATAAIGVANAIKMHDKYMSDNYGYPSAKEKATQMRHLMSAHEALTGNPVPEDVTGWKNAPVSAEDLEEFFKSKGLSSEAAAAYTSIAFKSFFVPETETKSETSIAKEIGTSFAGFSLPSFERK